MRNIWEPECEKAVWFVCMVCWCRDISVFVRRDRRISVSSFVPIRSSSPFGFHAKEKFCLSVLNSETRLLLRTSHIFTVPSKLQLASSASRTGLNATCSMPLVCPRSSVLCFTFSRSGFHTRSFLSEEPVAT